MTLPLNRRQILATGGAALLAGAVANPLSRAAAAVIPMTPEAGDIKIGLNPWLGYGQWFVAQKKDLYKANGLGKVELVNFTTDADLNAALASGQIQAGNIATHTAMAFAAAGLPIKIIFLMDVSMTADAMLSDGSISSVAELKGKQVAFEEGTTSDILLNFALSKAGLKITDVQKVPMPAADAGTALIAGKVPVAVTYEPYISLAKTQNAKIKMIASAGEDPGLISDVFVVRQDFLDSKPGQVLALVKTWEAALKDYRADTKGGRAIISEAVGAKPEELATAFDGVTYYSIAENKTQLSGDFLKRVAPDVMAAATKAGILTKAVDFASLIDGRFVDAAAK